MRRFYHGGPSGLHAILPPTRTGVPSSGLYGRLAFGFEAHGLAKPDRVYVTTSPEPARVFAALAPFRGRVCVYEVEPRGDLEEDPDCRERELSFSCESARVLRVVSTLSPSARMRIRRRVLHDG